MNKLKGGAIFVRPSYSFLNLANDSDLTLTFLTLT